MATIEQFTSKEEALKFLRSQEKIVVPKLFTYWNHSTQYKTGESETKRNVWDGIPADEINLKKEMSFLSRALRLRYAVDYKSLESVPITYQEDRKSKNLERLNIKVVMPKDNLNEKEIEQLVGDDKDYVKNLKDANSGLSDQRHQKLPSKTKIHIFAFMDHDEMSQKTVDTIIGVRDEDVIIYANEVRKELEEIKERGIDIEDSKVETPKDIGDVNRITSERETVILGDNLGIDFIKSKNQAKEQTQVIDNEDDKEKINIDELEQQVDNVMSGLKSKYGESSQMTTKSAIEDERKNRPLTVKSIYGLENESNDRVKYMKHYRASYQEMDTNAAKKQSEELKDKILDNAKDLSENGPHDNRVTYMLRDLVDLKDMMPVLEEMEQRTADLQYFEKYCRLPDEKPRFFDERLSAIEDVEVQKKGIFSTKKEIVRQQRKKNSSELQTSLDEDLQIIKYRLLRKEITQEEHDRCAESIQRLYGKELQMMNQMGSTEEVNSSENETNNNEVQQTNNTDSHNNAPTFIPKEKLKTNPLEENIANHPEGIIKASQKLAEQEPSVCGKLLGKIKGAVSNIFDFVNSRSKSNQGQLKASLQQQEAANAANQELLISKE